MNMKCKEIVFDGYRNLSVQCKREISTKFEFDI